MLNDLRARAAAAVFPSLPGVALVAAFGLDTEGVEVIGDVGTQVPKLEIPKFSIDDTAALLPCVIARRTWLPQRPGPAAHLPPPDGVVHRLDVRPAASSSLGCSPACSWRCWRLPSLLLVNLSYPGSTELGRTGDDFVSVERPGHTRWPEVANCGL
jgi:hypothetical protein